MQGFTQWAKEGSGRSRATMEWIEAGRGVLSYAVSHMRDVLGLASGAGEGEKGSERYLRL